MRSVKYSRKYSRRTLAALILLVSHAIYAHAKPAKPINRSSRSWTPSRLVQVRARGTKIVAPRARLIRYNGTSQWSLPDIEKVKAFFAEKFGRPLPISAFGQSASHSRLRFNHRHAVDVAVHPQSAEGKALTEYLRQEGIPFIAITGAIAGSATGPHIHVGKPSHKY